MAVGDKMQSRLGEFTVKHEDFIPREMIADRLVVIEVACWFGDMPVLDFCQNLLVGSYND